MNKSKLYNEGYAWGLGGCKSNIIGNGEPSETLDFFIDLLVKNTITHKHRNKGLYYEGVVNGLKQYYINNKLAKIKKNMFVFTYKKELPF